MPGRLRPAGVLAPGAGQRVLADACHERPDAGAERRPAGLGRGRLQRLLHRAAAGAERVVLRPALVALFRHQSRAVAEQAALPLPRQQFLGAATGAQRIGAEPARIRRPIRHRLELLGFARTQGIRLRPQQSQPRHVARLPRRLQGRRRHQKSLLFPLPRYLRCRPPRLRLRRLLSVAGSDRAQRPKLQARVLCERLFDPDAADPVYFLCLRRDWRDRAKRCGFAAVQRRFRDRHPADRRHGEPRIPGRRPGDRGSQGRR